MSQTNNRLPLWKKNTAVNGDFEPYLELFLLDDKPDAGLVLVLPGGGYILRADHEGAPVAENSTSWGSMPPYCSIAWLPENIRTLS